MNPHTGQWIKIASCSIKILWITKVFSCHTHVHFISFSSNRRTINTSLAISSEHVMPYFQDYLTQNINLNAERHEWEKLSFLFHSLYSASIQINDQLRHETTTTMMMQRRMVIYSYEQLYYSMHWFDSYFARCWVYACNWGLFLIYMKMWIMRVSNERAIKYIQGGETQFLWIPRKN